MCKKCLQFEHQKNITEKKKNIARNVQGLCMRSRSMNVEK